MIHGRDGAVARIVEELDASDEERAETEVNTSIFMVKRGLLGPALRRLDRTNSQSEYYLTDVVAVLYNAGHVTRSVLTEDHAAVAGVNDRVQLSSAEAELRRRINERWMQRGVTMWDPASTYVDADVELAEDVSLLPGTIVKGSCRIAAGAQIGPNALLVDVIVGARTQLGTVARHWREDRRRRRDGLVQRPRAGLRRPVGRARRPALDARPVGGGRPGRRR